MGLEIPIGMPLGQLTSDLNGAQTKLKKSLSSMETDLKFYQAIAKKSLDPNVVTLYNAKIQTTQMEIAKLANVGKAGFDEIGNAVGKSKNLLQQGLAGLLRWAYILPGIGVAGILAFAIEPIGKFISSLAIFNQKLSESKLALVAMGEALKSSEYQEAVKNVSELTINIDLAKQGFISKEGVLKHYNETVGKTTGQVTSLDEAEKALTKNAQAYIQFTLLKAAAQIALGEAAKAAYETALQTQKDEVRQKKFANTAIIAGDKEMIGLQKVLTKELKRETDQRLKDGKEAQQKQINIAKQFQAEAAKIAKQGGFNFFADTKTAKPAKEEKQHLFPAINPDNWARPLKNLIPADSPLRIENHLAGKSQQEMLRKNLAIMGEITANWATSIGGILEKLNLNVSNILEGGIVQSFEGLGTAIGNSLAGAGNIFENLGQALLQSLGSILGQLGQMAIATGVAILGIKTALKTLNPFAAIAAGVALLALSGFVRGSANKLGSSIGSGGGSAASPPAPVSMSGSNSSGGNNNIGITGGSVVFEISGVSLYGVLNRAGYKLQRIGPV